MSKLFSIIFILFFTITSPVLGAVAVGDTSVLADFGDTSHTLSHDVAGENTCLVVNVAVEAGNTVSGVTYNGDALTQVVTTSYGNDVDYQWRLVAPDGGTHDIIVTHTWGNVNIYAVTLTGVDQDDPVVDTDTYGAVSPAISMTLTAVADGAVVALATAYGTGVESFGPLNGQTTITPDETWGEAGYLLTDSASTTIGWNTVVFGEPGSVEGSGLAVTYGPVGSAPAGGTAYSILGVGTAATAGKVD